MNEKLTIEDVEAFLRLNRNRFGVDYAVKFAKQLADTMHENERLREALQGLDAMGYLKASGCAGRDGNMALKAARDALALCK